jgi:hypothetical protein
VRKAVSHDVAPADQEPFMADTKTNEPVTTTPDSAARVAFDLALRITQDSRMRPEQRDEKYWLALYRKCHDATHGIG